MNLSARYLAYCPNCHRAIVEERLQQGVACETCQPDITRPPKPGRLTQFLAQQEQLAAWTDFFTRHVGTPPWPLQRTWAARVLNGQSFAMLAPTGIGKTTFGLVTAHWFSQQGKRSYLIFPTRLLVEQALHRLQAWGSDAVAYLGRKKDKDEILTGEHLIALFTVAFLYRNQASLPRPVDFLFVDDVDSLLKSARNVHHVLALLGFTDKDIQTGMHLIAQRRNDPKRAEQTSARLRGKAKGILAVSSATARPRSQRVLLFRELLGFEVGVPQIALRKVVDAYDLHINASTVNLYKTALQWLQRLGKGGLLFLPGDQPQQTAEELRDFLRSHGVQVLTYADKDAIVQFQQGQVDYLIGFASWRNPLARGLDVPERIRYALFVGVPKIRLPLQDTEDVQTLLRIGVALLPILRNTSLEPELLRLKRTRSPNKSQIQQLVSAIKSLLSDEDIRRKVEEHPEVGLRFEGDRPVLIFADVTGYLQASGRTSRLTPAGLTQGLALLLAEDEKAFAALQHRLEYILETPPQPVESVDIEAVCRRIDEDRARLQRGEKRGLSLPSAAVIVESPNKARTIATFFGKPLRRYLPGLVAYEILNEQYHLTITATRGHVTDLALEGGVYGVEVEETIRPRYHPLRQCPEGTLPAPTCRDGRPSQPDRDLALQSLQRLALEVDTFYIATDPDTEGEKIAWDVYLALRAFTPHIHRVEFHAVTPREFRQALETPREIAQSLVASQKVRRIADRWVGFTLSQILQRAFKQANLSAGRVQTPVLGWLIEREKRTQERLPVTEVHLPQRTLRFPGHVKSTRLKIELVETREVKRHPPPPYTTDMLLRDANRTGISVTQAINLAQDLFEAGYITYHRTDSTHISPEGMALGKRWISKMFGEEYAHPRSWGPEGHHEAIRPTRLFTPEDMEEAIWLGTTSLTEKHVHLYRLIVARFLASQMIPARVQVTRYRFRLGEQEQEEEVITNILEPGYTRVLPLGKVAPLQPGTYTVAPRYLQVPAATPFTEGDLVEEMKRRGIGRPSTYALIVDRLLTRGYARRQGPYIIPTRLGKHVYRYLVEDSPRSSLIRPYVSEAFTRELEALMDEIEAGLRDPAQVLRQLLDVVETLAPG